MRVRVKISILKNTKKPFMGPGPLFLLENIRKHKSINKAAKSMSLSYVKALNMQNRLERNLEHKILVRKRGGKDRGGAELTPFAENYIEQYRRFETKVSEFSEGEFQSFVKNVSKFDENSPT